MTKEQKLSEIKKEFYKLYCFTSTEIENYLSTIEYFPDEGLDAVLESLQEGKQLQDEFLFKKIENDKNYGKNLNTFLQTTSNKIKDKFHKGETVEAEQILKQI